MFELTGTLRGSSEPVTALYAGNGSNLEFIAASLFATPCSQRKVRDISPLRIPSALSQAQLSADIVIVERPPAWALLGASCGDISFPAWIGQEVQLDRAAPGQWLLGRHLEREVQRQIRRHDYRLSISDTPADRTVFFDEFYRPYIHSRHGNAAVTVDRKRFDSVVATASLARLFAGDTWIAGMFLQWRPHSLRFGWFGSRQNPPTPGASEVLDVLCIRMAAERGVDRIDLGHSRPSLADGVVRYKKKFGARFVIPRYPQTRIELQLQGQRPALRQWLAERQFLCDRDNGLCIATYSSDARAQVTFTPVGEPQAA